MVPERAITLVREAEEVLILTHHNPDGDAIGSSVGLALALMGEGKKADIFLAGTWSDHLAFLLSGLSVKRSFAQLAAPGAYDLVALLDCHSFSRVGDEGEALERRLAAGPSAPAQLVIDHHLLVEGETKGDSWVHQASASSTGELVWELLKTLGWTPPQAALQALLLAIASDTGFFSQSNTSSGALAAASDLVALGGDLEEVNRKVKKDLPLRRLKLMGLVLDSLKLHFGGRLATMMVTPAMLDESGALLSDTEDFVELGRSLAGVSLSVLAKDSGEGPGGVRVSLRSRSEVDAASLAQLMGGGGHRQAAAYNDPTASTAAEALENLLRRVRRFYEG